MIIFSRFSTRRPVGWLHVDRGIQVDIAGVQVVAKWDNEQSGSRESGQAEGLGKYVIQAGKIQ